MRRIRHRLFARTRKRKGGFGQLIDLRRIELAGFRRARSFPSRLRAALILDLR
jgi:hypothetical protein